MARLFFCWLRLQFAWKRETKSKLRLFIGSRYLKKGACIQVGQPIKLKKANGVKLRYVDNIYYNFKQNRVTPKLTNGPVKGYSERFKKA